MDIKAFNAQKKRATTRYDELEIFLIAFSYCLSFAMDGQVREASMNLAIYGDRPSRSLFLAVLFVASLVVSLREVFVKGPKSDKTKGLMLGCAVSLSGVIGVLAGAEMLGDMDLSSMPYLIVFPIWNIVSAFVLACGYILERFDSSCVSDKDASPLATVIGASLIILVAFVCTYIYQIKWIITLSICLGWASGISKTVSALSKNIESEVADFFGARPELKKRR